MTENPEKADATPQEIDVANYSPEQLQFLIENGLIDPSMIPEGVLPKTPYASAETGVYDQGANADPYSLSQSDEELEARSLQEELAAAEKEAIDDATRPSNGKSDLNSALAVEAAEHDDRVIHARQEVKDSLGTRAKGVEEAATTEAIKESRLDSANPKELVTAAVNGRSPKEAIEKRAPRVNRDEASETDNADEEFAELVDKVNGDAEAIVDTQTQKDLGQMKKLGLDQISKHALRRRIVASGGANLTNKRRQSDVADEMLGHALLGASTKGKPKITDAKLRDSVREIARNPGELRLLSEAAARMKHGGRVSAETKKRIGRSLRQHSRR
jgi:hypothetical protein